MRGAVYSWHLREVMARNRVYTATELVPMLQDREYRRHMDVRRLPKSACGGSLRGAGA